MTTIEVPLSQGLVALVDEVDATAVSTHNWVALRSGNTYYAARHIRRPNGTRSTQGLHTFLTGWPMTDHRNGDGLDNRRSNLREATKAQNSRNRVRPRTNTSGFKGVAWGRRQRKWQAYITFAGQRHHLGYHVAPEDAARAYDEAALKYHGEFARLNFPGEVVA